MLGYLTQGVNLALILGSIHYGQVHPSSTCSTYVHLHLLALQGADGQKLADLQLAKMAGAGSSTCICTCRLSKRWFSQ